MMVDSELLIETLDMLKLVCCRRCVNIDICRPHGRHRDCAEAIARLACNMNTRMDKDDISGQ